MSKSSTKIEQAAVNCITDAFYASQRLEPYIPIGDREPSWDGNIYIKHGSKSYSRIPTQVKGKMVNKIPLNPSYSISRTNLENYKRDGGLVYFVVYLIGEKRYPFYRFLAPIDLQRYIKNTNGRNSVSVSLYPLEKVEGDLENKFIQFYFDCKKQTSFNHNSPILLEDAIDKGYSLNFQIHGVTNEEDALNYVMNNDIYLYANIKFEGKSIWHPIGDKPYKLVFLKTIESPVICNGKEYYTSYQVGGNKDRLEIVIDDFLRIHKDNSEDKYQIDICLNMLNLQKFYDQLSFTYDFVRTNLISLGSNNIVSERWSDKDRRKISEDYKKWTQIMELFKILHIDTTLMDISTLKNSDYLNIEILIKAILDKEEIFHQHTLPGLTTMEIGPYKLLLWVERVREGRYLIYDFWHWQKGKISCVDDDNNQKVAISIFSFILQRDDFNAMINIDYDCLIDTYEIAAQYNREISIIANNDVLRLIHNFDTMKHKDVRLLRAALILTEWIERLPEVDSEWFIYRLNTLQINKRLRVLTEEEKNELIKISDSNIPNFGKWAANLLLDDFARVDIYWKQMNHDEQDLYRSYPIYLFESLRCNQNTTS